MCCKGSEERDELKKECTRLQKEKKEETFQKLETCYIYSRDLFMIPNNTEKTFDPKKLREKNQMNDVGLHNVFLLDKKSG